MDDGRWKLSVDHNGVTIASDRFQLTTVGPAMVGSEFELDETVFAAAESSQIEAIVSELEAMTKRTYGQYCGLSRAMELVGERWTLLIIRDLFVSPKSVADLMRGLPRIPEDTLLARMRELEHAGVVCRQVLPDEAVRYELTDYGAELEDILLRFGRWGTRVLGDPRPEEIITTDSMVIAMRAMFDPHAAHGVRTTYEIHIGEIVFHVRVNDGTMHAAAGPVSDADVVLDAGRALTALLSGDLKPADALADGSVHLTGDPALLDKFAEMFHLPSPPSVARG